MIKKLFTITAIIGAGATFLLSRARKLTPPKNYDEVERLARTMHDDDCPSLYSAYTGCTCGE